MADDIIKMNTDIVLQTDEGTPIEVKTQEPEYMVETFSWNGIDRNVTIKTGEE